LTWPRVPSQRGCVPFGSRVTTWERPGSIIASRLR
jgi:hypothetical protein